MTSRQYRLLVDLVPVLIEFLCKRNDGFLYVTLPRQHNGPSQKPGHPRYCFLLYSEDFDTGCLVCCCVIWSVLVDRSRCIVLPRTTLLIYQPDLRIPTSRSPEDDEQYTHCGVKIGSHSGSVQSINKVVVFISVASSYYYLYKLIHYHYLLCVFHCSTLKKPSIYVFRYLLLCLSR